MSKKKRVYWRVSIHRPWRTLVRGWLAYVFQRLKGDKTRKRVHWQIVVSKGGRPVTRPTIMGVWDNA